MTVFGLQHIGLTVPDMAQAVRFFETMFGAVVCLSTGRLDLTDADMIRKLGVPGDRRIEDITVLRVGNGTNLELFQYSGEPDPDARSLVSPPGCPGATSAYEPAEMDEEEEPEG